MTTKTDAAAHREALQKGDDRFGVVEDLGIQSVFVRPELSSESKISGTAGLVKLRNIAPGTKCAIARSVKNNVCNGIVVPPAIQGAFNVETHGICHGVQGRRAIESNAPAMSGGANNYISHGDLIGPRFDGDKSFAALAQELANDAELEPFWGNLAASPIRS